MENPELRKMEHPAKIHQNVTALKPAWRLLMPWHSARAWFLSRKIQRQHRELAKYIRRSAYEISAWKQDIGFLEQQLEGHLARAGVSVPAVPPKDNVVQIEGSDLISPAGNLAMMR